MQIVRSSNVSNYLELATIEYFFFSSYQNNKKKQTTKHYSHYRLVAMPAPPVCSSSGPRSASGSSVRLARIVDGRLLVALLPPSREKILEIRSLTALLRSIPVSCYL